MPARTEACSRARAGNLAGKNILITRQREFASSLIKAITQRNGNPIAVATIAIEYRSDVPEILELMRSPMPARIVLFTSRNAVRATANHLDRTGAKWPRLLRCAAVGPQTAAEIKARLSPAQIIVPNRNYGTESLLKLPQLYDLKGISVTVVDGGGDSSETLLASLRQRGCAGVSHARVYRRVLPAINATFIRNALGGEPPDFVIATSVTGIQNLVQLLDPQWTALLRRSCVIAYSERIAEQALHLRFARVIAATESSDDAVVAALERECV